MIKEKLAPAFKKMGMADEQVASLFNEDGTEFAENATETILKYDATRVQKMKDDGTKLFNDGHKKGLSEGASKIEKEIVEKYGISSDKIGIELIDELIASKSATGSSTLDEEKVKLHPAYVKMQDELSKQIKQKDKEWDEKFKQRDSEIAKQNLFKEVVAKAKATALGLKPLLPKDAAKAERQMELLVAELSKLGFNKTEDGNDYILEKEGKPVEDAHGNRINFDAYVKSVAESIWDFEQGQQRSSAQNSNDATGSQNQQNKWAGAVPKTEAEYIKAVSGAKDASERIAIQDAYKASIANSN
jgi:hypothetical protein